MFKNNSGRKQESSVWKYFDYELSVDKSKCKIENCGSFLKGKNATNLMNHLKSKHNEIANSLILKEKDNAHPAQLIQPTLQVNVLNIFLIKLLRNG